MLAEWRKTGLGRMLVAAYRRGVPMVGLSAGAIGWFDRMYTDTQIVEGVGEDYILMDGWGLMRGMMTPHYNMRTEFDEIVLRERALAYAIEDNCALHFADGVVKRTITTGGKAYLLDAREGTLQKTEINLQ